MDLVQAFGMVLDLVNEKIFIGGLIGSVLDGKTTTDSCMHQGKLPVCQLVACASEHIKAFQA